MKRLLLGVALLLVFLTGLSCARIFPPAGPATGPAPTPVAEAPLIPHGLSEGCLACHGEDARFLAALQTVHPVPIPPGFTGSPEEACQLCHAMEKGHTVARAIPHPLEGMEACLACHAGGAPGVLKIPSNHVGYVEEMCARCHAPGTAP